MKRNAPSSHSYHVLTHAFRAENIPQGDVAKHRETCPLEVVWCEYHDMRCDARFAQKDNYNATLPRENS